MVDPIGLRPTAPVDRRATVTDAVEAVQAAARAPAPQAEQPQVAETGVRVLARELSARPPVDHERVREIKRAIAEGRFPIVPAKIADRLIAAQMQWMADDAD